MSENLDLYGDLGTEHALQPKESYEEVRLLPKHERSRCSPGPCSPACTSVAPALARSNRGLTLLAGDRAAKEEDGPLRTTGIADPNGRKGGEARDAWYHYRVRIAKAADPFMAERRHRRPCTQAKIASMQNVALKRNISCLYKTAKAELDRKDAEIQRLRQQLAARGGGSRRSK